nr:hypothetical protein [Tanacetum cinerariifolium]
MLKMNWVADESIYEERTRVSTHAFDESVLKKHEAPKDVDQPGELSNSCLNLGGFYKFFFAFAFNSSYLTSVKTDSVRLEDVLKDYSRPRYEIETYEFLDKHQHKGMLKRVVGCPEGYLRKKLLSGLLMFDFSRLKSNQEFLTLKHRVVYSLEIQSVCKALEAFDLRSSEDTNTQKIKPEFNRT